jgi:multidrug efflux pump subunit AcrB
LACVVDPAVGGARLHCGYLGFLLRQAFRSPTLFGLVLAIGIVVDDAIVVVENVERNIEAGLSLTRPSGQREVSGPVIAVALVLCAVFAITFVPGLTGQFYKQFAVTIAISTLISAFTSLTLSPALSAILLRPRRERPLDARHGQSPGRFFAAGAACSAWQGRVRFSRRQWYRAAQVDLLDRPCDPARVPPRCCSPVSPLGFVPAST